MDITGILIVIAVIFFFGGLLKLLVKKTQDTAELALNVGEANAKVWAMEQRRSIAKRATKANKKGDVPSWDELDKMLD